MELKWNLILGRDPVLLQIQELAELIPERVITLDQCPSIFSEIRHFFVIAK